MAEFYRSHHHSRKRDHEQFQTEVKTVSKETVLNALKTVKYPGFSRDIVSFGLVRSVEFENGKAVVNIAVSTADHSIPKQIRDDIEAALDKTDGVEEADVNIVLTAAKKGPASQTSEPSSLPGVKYAIAVASGKGGVGKSTFSVNLACTISRILAPEGKKVSLLDCDIYGPSVPLMMGVEGRPDIEGESLIPLEGHGIKVMSMGFLVDEDTPVVWRGPMIQKTITQFIHNVMWGEIEVMIIDLPPGTGDAQLSLVQTIPLNGAIIVTTPQLAATQVAKRGAKMLEKTNVKILGVAENMSYLLNPDGSKVEVFGAGGGQKTADDLNTDFLGKIPLDPSIREGGDSGKPVALTSDSQASQSFEEIARNILKNLS